MTKRSSRFARVGRVGIIGCAMAALPGGCTGTIVSQGDETGQGAGSGGGNTGGPGSVSGTGDTGGAPIGVIPPLPPGFAPEFTCTPSETPIAQSLKRLSKTQIVNALGDFMSQLTAANRSAVLTALQAKIDLLPDNTSQGGYTAFDNSVIQDHVNALVDISTGLSGLLAPSDAYVGQLVAVCGAGSTRASLATDACLTRFIEYYGLKVMHRPVTTTETTTFKTFYQSEGLDSLIARLVLQPLFYYQVDIDGQLISGSEGVDAAYKLTPYEFVSKLSLLFWDGPPSDDLYAQAAGLDMADDAAIGRVLDAVLTSDRAQVGVRQFYTQWLDLGHVPAIKGLSSPAWKAFAKDESLDLATADHRTHMVTELLDLAGHTTLSGGGFDDLLTSTTSFARTADLAKIYGVAVWDGDAANPVAFPADQPRAGLLTRAATLLSGSEYTSGPHRGRQIRQSVLCDTIPDPDPAVLAKFTQTQPDVNKTIRQRIEENTGAPSCNACHAQLNLGYMLDGYDSLGRYRTQEMTFNASGTPANMLPVNAQAVAALFDEDTTMLDGGVQMSDHIAKSGKADLCMVRNYFRFSHGRMEDEAADGCSLESLWKNSFATEGNLLLMLKELTRRPSFRSRKVI